MNMGKLLKAKNGGYTPYDLAQYIFWTGDEAGVAQAIEDLIDEGLVSIVQYVFALRNSFSYPFSEWLTVSQPDMIRMRSR